MNIKLFYFKGCPTYLESAENLKFVLNELELNTNIEMIEVKNPDEAIAKKFMGSPTIRINGEDIERTEGEYMFGCRIYRIDGKTTGTPTKEFIKSKLISFLNKK